MNLSLIIIINVLQYFVSDRNHVFSVEFGVAELKNRLYCSLSGTVFELIAVLLQGDYLANGKSDQ